MAARNSLTPQQGLGFFGLLILLCSAVLGKSQMCEVETGQTNIILDIEESRESCKYTTLLLHWIIQYI